MNDRDKNLLDNSDAPNSWCVLPWTHVSIKSAGTFRVCCHSAASASRGTLTDNNGEPLHVSTASWEEVVNNDTMKSVRKEMLDGKWPEPCIRCKREFDSGMPSRNFNERSMMADLVEYEKYPSFKKAKELTKSDGSIDNKDFPIGFLDIRFGNLCNLKCVMCGPGDSNQWYDDYNKIWGYDHFFDNGKKIFLEKNSKGKLDTKENIFNWSDDQALWSQIEKYIDQFRRIYIVGGEPFMINSHYDFLQKCVDGGYAEKLTIEYNSNITNIPPRAWEIWKKFKNVLIGVSVDGLGKVNDVIRHPSNWKKIEENLKKFSTSEGNFDVHITTTIQILNIWHLPEFIEYIIVKNYSRIGPWKKTPIMSPHPVHRPAYLNVNILPDDFKEKIKTRFEDYKTKFRETDYQSLIGNSSGASWDQKVDHACRILDTYYEYMFKITYPEKELKKWRSNFIHLMSKLDTIRGTNWKETFPEVYDATISWHDLPKDLY